MPGMNPVSPRSEPYVPQPLTRQPPITSGTPNADLAQVKANKVSEQDVALNTQTPASKAVTGVEGQKVQIKGPDDFQLGLHLDVLASALFALHLAKHGVVEAAQYVSQLSAQYGDVVSYAQDAYAHIQDYL